MVMATFGPRRNGDFAISHEHLARFALGQTEEMLGAIDFPRDAVDLAPVIRPRRVLGGIGKILIGDQFVVRSGERK